MDFSGTDFKREIARIAEAWKKQYCSEGGSWAPLREGEDSALVFAELEKLQLQENPKPTDVHRVMGNKSWVGLDCDECRARVWPFIQFGREDEEGDRPTLCIPCARKIEAVIGTGRW